MISLLLAGLLASPSALEEPPRQREGAAAVEMPSTAGDASATVAGSSPGTLSESSPESSQGQESAPARFEENAQKFHKRIQLKAGVEGIRIEFTVHRWGEPSSGTKGFLAKVTEKPSFIEKVRWPEGDRLEFAEGEHEKTLVLELDTEKKTVSNPEGDLHIVIEAADEDVFPSERVFEIPFRTQVLEDAKVVAYALEEDAPEEFPFEETIDHCDRSLQPIYKYDRIGLFFTPARDFQPPLTEKHFIHGLFHSGGEVAASTGLEPERHYVIFREEDGKVLPSLPYAKLGSPGKFAVVVDLWSESNADGEYVLKTTDGYVVGGLLLGVGDPYLEPVPGAEPQEEGTFEVVGARLFFKGFVMEERRKRSLAEDVVCEGAMAVEESVDETAGRVTIAAEASWRLTEEGEREGERVPVGDPLSIRGGLTIRFPTELDPGDRIMGELDVEAAAVAGTGASGGRTDAGGQVRRVFDYDIRAMVPTNRLPPDRYLCEGTDTPSSWGSVKEKGVRTLFERGWHKYLVQPVEQPVSAKLEVHSGGHTTRSGVPARLLPWHLRDGETIWVIPVSVNFTHPNRDFLFSRPQVSIWGYAIYGATAGIYDGPRPRGPDDRGEGAPGDGEPTAAERDALIREWLRVAEPPLNATEGAALRYNDWGVMVGRTRSCIITATPGIPDEARGMTSTEYCWSKGDVLDSVDHCTLREWVTARLAGESTERCRGRYSPVKDGGVGSNVGTAHPRRDPRDDAHDLAPSADDHTAPDSDRDETDAAYGPRPDDAAGVADILADEEATQRTFDARSDALDVPYDGPAPGTDADHLASQGLEPSDLAGDLGPPQALDAPTAGDLQSPPPKTDGYSDFLEGRREATNAVTRLMQNQLTAALQERAAAESAVRNHPIPTRGGMEGIAVRGVDRVDLVLADHGQEDGDRVMVIVGDRTLFQNLTLTNRPQRYAIALPSRFTPIKIIALNTGSVGPNTARVEVAAGARVLAGTNWNLQTYDVGSTCIRRDP